MPIIREFLHKNVLTKKIYFDIMKTGYNNKITILGISKIL